MTQIATPLIDVSRLPHTALRTGELYLKKRVFALEALAVKRLQALYREAYRDLASALVDMDTAPFTQYAAGRVERLKRNVLVSVERSARTALVGGYFGRLWLLDVGTRADVRVNMPPLTQDALREDMYDALIQDLLGRKWRSQYELELDDLTLGIRRAIGTGLTNGESMDAIQRRVRDAMGITTDRRRGAVGSAERRGYRANFARVQTMTRTVVQTVANRGTLSAYKANSDILSGYEWLTANDERVCPDCRGMDGKVFSFKARKLPPLHPNCILPGNEVVLPGELVGATKSFYNGRAVEIAFSDGRIITVTANHPILTLNGWVKAQDLNLSHYVIGTSDAERVALSINPNNQHRPTAIEQVFRAFEESSEVTTCRMVVPAENFYGDARFFDGEIDVVSTNRLLMGSADTAFSQPASEQSFGWEDVGLSLLSPDSGLLQLSDAALSPSHCSVCGRDHSLSLGIGSALPAHPHGVGNAAWRDSGFYYAPSQEWAAEVVFDSERLLGLPADVATDNDVEVFDILSSAAYIDTGIAKSATNGFWIDLKLARDFIDRLAGTITIDPIASVRVFDFSGHVYDLQCEPYELYICNGVVVKNCRCTVIPVIKPDALEDGGKAPRVSFQRWAQGFGMERELAMFMGER